MNNNTSMQQQEQQPAQASSRAEEDQIIKQAIEIIEARMVELGETMTSPDETRRYVRAWLQLRFQEAEQEFFGVIWLATNHRVIKTEILFMGTISTCNVYPREVVKAGLACNAAAVLFFHNHPSGSSQPSAADKTITSKLQSVLDILEIRVLDHLIVGKNQIYSFAEHGIL